MLSSVGDKKAHFIAFLAFSLAGAAPAKAVEYSGHHRADVAGASGPAEASVNTNVISGNTAANQSRLPPAGDVLSRHLWAVNLGKTNDGRLFCEAFSSGMRDGSIYDVRLRRMGNARLLMVIHSGADVAGAKDAAFSVDGQSPMTLPIMGQMASGIQRDIVVGLPDNVFENDFLPRLTTPQAKILTIRVGANAYDTPVFGFNAVMKAFGKCQEREKQMTDAANAANSSAPTLETYEAILAKERTGLQTIAAFDLATTSPADAKQKLKAMAAQLDQDIGWVPSSSDDPKLHDIYVAGARAGIKKAFKEIRLWEGDEIGKLPSDRARFESEFSKLHAQKVLEFRDVEASLLRDDIERLVNNPNLSAVEICDLAKHALADDGQKLQDSAHTVLSPATPIPVPATPIAAQPFTGDLPLKLGAYAPATRGCAPIEGNYADYNSIMNFDGKNFSASSVVYTIAGAAKSGTSYELHVNVTPNGGIGYVGDANTNTWNMTIKDITDFMIKDHDPVNDRSGAYVWCAKDTNVMMNANYAAPPPPAPEPAATTNVFDVASLPSDADPLIHNGSRMSALREKGLILYLEPKASIAGTIRPGTVLFRGVLGKKISGTAYVFKGGCAPAPYHVEGRNYDITGFVLKGAAPIRDPHSCAILGYTRASRNARLVFDAAGGFRE